MTVGEAKKMMFNFFVENNFDIDKLEKILIDYIELVDLCNKSIVVVKIIVDSFFKYKEFKMGGKNE